MSEDTGTSVTSPTSSGGELPAPVASAGIATPGGERPSGVATTSPDYRDDLSSRRWNAAPLRNPEVEKTDPRIAVAAILILATLTMLVLLAGYASGFWQLPGAETASGAVAALELLA